MTSFGQIVESVKTLTEEEIFKAADQPELTKRRAAYDEERRKEQERVRKEREKEIKALGMNPKYKKIMALIPVVTELWDEYTDNHADWSGHYALVNTYDAPTHLSFNIKMGGTDVPDWARKKMDELDLWGSYESYYWEYLSDQLSGFAEGLQEDYGFINEWYQEGRMGGWLVLHVESMIPEDMDTVIEAFEKPDGADESWFTRAGINEAYGILKEMKRNLESRIKDYQAIANKVERARKDTQKYAESKEYWETFLSPYIEDQPVKVK